MCVLQNSLILVLTVLVKTSLVLNMLPSLVSSTLDPSNPEPCCYIVRKGIKSESEGEIK